MHVIKGCNQLNMLRQQHTITKYVARHIPDAHDSKIIGLNIDTALTEVTLHRHPGSACGDAHLLMVVTYRTAGRKTIAHPEAAIHSNFVSDI